MTTFGIIFFICFLLWSGLIIYKSDEDISLSIFGSLIITCIIFVCFLFIGLINVKREKSNTFGVTYISSLNLNSSIKGDFFLGTGSIESKDYYYFMTNNTLGYKIAKIEITYNVYVREDEDKSPFIEFTKYNTTKINWFGRLFFKKSLYNKDGEIIIHVPKNSVIKRYNVDLKDL